MLHGRDNFKFVVMLVVSNILGSHQLLKTNVGDFINMFPEGFLL